VINCQYSPPYWDSPGIFSDWFDGRGRGWDERRKVCGWIITNRFPEFRTSIESSRRGSASFDELKVSRQSYRRILWLQMSWSLRVDCIKVEVVVRHLIIHRNGGPKNLLCGFDPSYSGLNFWTNWRNTSQSNLQFNSLINQLQPSASYRRIELPTEFLKYRAATYGKELKQKEVELRRN